ncbi:SCO6745 family protein [Mycolicibacterium goodii]|uniref:SalK n=1 Tax=Mycolicibacterium goodii TaxID=134601 RepID=A0A0K0XAI3_MYCGD|nr:salK [Mycolicibacterium goodii]
MGRSPSLARRFYDRLEPVHAVIYFAPENRAALEAFGFRGFWMTYFATRSAPLGPVAPEVVASMFYNFTLERVARTLPAAWDLASPSTVLKTRTEAAVTALRRSGVADTPATRTAADLAARAASNASLDARPLYAANRALDWPDEPIAKLWHAVTLLREHRGDGHVAVLAAEGISGRECNVLHAAAGRVPAEMIKRSRDYDDEQWDFHVDALRRRGWLDGQGALTEAGCAVKRHVEDRTDTLALSALDVLGDAEVESLFATLTPITRLVVAAGDVPAATPMGLNRDDLDDDGAHLG